MNDSPTRSTARSEYGGGPGRNDRNPDGTPRELSAAEQAADMRREGIRNSTGNQPRVTRPDPRY